MCTSIIESTSYGLLLKNLCQTRWYARYNALSAVYLSFSTLLEYSMKLEEDSDAKSQCEVKALLNELHSFEFVVLLIFSRHITALTNATTTQLQKEDLDILSAVVMLTSLLILLQNLRNDDYSSMNIFAVTVTRLLNVILISIMYFNFLSVSREIIKRLSCRF